MAQLEETTAGGALGGTAQIPGIGQFQKGQGAIAIWLFVMCGLVALMVLVGGATRLTDSGLSITEWKPVTGAIPPLSHSDWLVEFENTNKSLNTRSLIRA